MVKKPKQEQKQEQKVLAKVSEEEAKEMGILVAEEAASKAIINHALVEATRINAQVRLRSRDFWFRMYQKYKLNPGKIYTLNVAEREVVLSKQPAAAAPKK